MGYEDPLVARMAKTGKWKKRQPALDWKRIATSDLTEPHNIVRRWGGESRFSVGSFALTLAPPLPKTGSGPLNHRPKRRERREERQKNKKKKKGTADLLLLFPGEQEKRGGGRTCCLPSPASRCRRRHHHRFSPCVLPDGWQDCGGRDAVGTGVVRGRRATTALSHCQETPVESTSIFQVETPAPVVTCHLSCRFRETELQKCIIIVAQV